MKEEELKRKLEKYYDGSSTIGEEEELRKYFTSGNVLPGYEAEKAIFGFWTDSEPVPEPSREFEGGILKAIDEYEGKARHNALRRWLLPALSAAAGLLILAGTFLFLEGKREPADTFRDPRLAYAETVRILMDVSSRMNHAKESLHPVGKMNLVRNRSLETLGRSASLIEKNLRPLGYLSGQSSASAGDTSGK